MSFFATSPPRATEVTSTSIGSRDSLFDSPEQLRRQADEVIQLRRELDEKNSAIYRLQQSESELPRSRIESEIGSFAQFVQTTLRKFSETKSLSSAQKESLEQSARQFLAIRDSTNLKQKVTQFFDEVQNYCNILIDKALERAVNGTAIPSDGDSPDVSKALHDSEMQKLKLQNQLFRAERRLDEETEANQAMRDQMKSEHMAIAQLTTKLFPGSSVLEDQFYVRKEMGRIEQAFDKAKKELLELKSRESQLAQLTSTLSDRAGRQSLTGDLVVDLRGLLEKSLESAEENADGLQRVASVLKVQGGDVDAMLYEIHRGQKATAELGQAKKELVEVKNQNREMGDELESLSQVSRENERANAQNEVLSKQVRQYQVQLAAVSEESSDLKHKVKALIKQNEKLLEDQKVNEEVVSKTTKDLSETQVEVQVTKGRLADVTKAHEALQDEFTRLSRTYATLTAEHEGLTKDARETATELKIKKTALAQVTEALQVANEELVQLREKVEEYEIEKSRYEKCSAKLSSVMSENQQYLEEMHKQSVQIAVLSPVKANLARMTERCAQLSESLEEAKDAYEAEKEKVKQMKPKVKEAEFLAKKVAEFEVTIARLNKEVAENARLKMICDQREKTIASLTHHSDSLESQVASLSSTNRDLMETSQKVASLRRSLDDSETRVKQLTVRNKQINDRLTNISAEKGELEVQLEIVTDKCDKLETENDRLKSSEKELISSSAKAKLLKEQNAALSEGIKTFESHNKTLSSRMASLSEQVDELQRQLVESEDKRKFLESQLQAQLAVSDGLREVEDENRRLRRENQKATAKVTELQSLHGSISSQLDTKAAIVQNLSTQLTQIQSSLRANKARIAELESQKESLQAQVETKAMIIANYEHQIEELRETNETLVQVTKQSKTMSERVAQLETKNRTLQARYEQVSTVADTARSNSALLETKQMQIDDLNRQVRTLRDANDDLMGKNRKLELEVQNSSDMIDQKEDELREQKRLNKSLSSSMNSQIQAKSSLVEELQNENRELAMRVKELEQAGQRSMTSIQKENRELVAELSQSQKENMKLTRACERLNKKVEELTLELSKASLAKRQAKNLQLQNDQLQEEVMELTRAKVRDQNSSALLQQKDEVIKQLRSLVDSQEASIAAYEQRQAKLERFKRTHESSTVDSLVTEIESTLQSFPIDRSTASVSTNTVDKLRSILDMTQQIHQIYERKTPSPSRYARSKL